ncbi:MAG: DMT family transporter [Candidatus Diapherotrites archaeon]|nr:DMT family transporter [Candidatus Diapherotrites archaeon]
MDRTSLAGAFYVFLSAAFLGTFWVISSLLVQSLSPQIVNFYWFFFGGLLLLPIGICFYRKELLSARGKKQMVLSGFFNILATFFSLLGISLVGGGATALLVQSMVVFSALFGFIFFRETLNRFKMGGIIVVLAGATLMNFDKTLLVSGGTFFGILSAFFYSLAYLSAKKASLNSTPFVVNAIRTFSAIFFAIPILLFTGQPFVIPSIEQAGLIFFGSALSVVIGMTLFYKGLKEIKLAYATAIKINEATFALIYSLIFAVSIPSGIVVIGGVLVLAGSAVIALKGDN